MGWVVFLDFLENVAIAYAASAAINYFFGKKADPTVFSPKFSDNQAQVRSAVEAHKIVYGSSLTSGPLVFAAANGPNNQYMHIVVPVAGHEVEAIDTVYFDDISSDGTQFNKIEVWYLDGAMTVANESWVWAVRINGKNFYGIALNNYRGNHSRIKTTRDVMQGIYNCIVGASGYASENYTAIWDGNFRVTLTAKALNDELTVSSLPPGSYSSECGVASYTDRGGYVTATLGQKAHIFDLTKHLGSPSQVADANLVAENVGWTVNHRLRGRAYVYAKLGFYADRWPTGIPALKAVVRGRKVYDPRTTLTAWSDNPALCIRDYLTAVFGLGCASTEIDDAAFIAAANICDEYVLASSPISITSSSVANPTVLYAPAHKFRTGDEAVISGHTGSTPSINGNTVVTVVDADHVTIPVNVTVGGTGGTIQLRQKRYTCNGVITLGEKPIDVIQKLLTSCDGTLVYTNGLYALQAAAYTAPVGDLNESHLRDSLQILAKPPRKQLFNGITGTILDPTQYWQETNFPPYKNATYATEDNEEILRDITLPFTNDSFAAQRLAKQMLERARQGVNIVFPAKLSAFQFAVGDVVRVSIAYLGWVNKEFRLLSWSLSNFGVDLQLQEEASASYNWNNGDETVIDPAPNTNLPSIFTAGQPTAVTAVEELYQATNTGGVRTRIKVSWTAAADANIVNSVVYWRSFSDSDQAAVGTASAHSEPVLDTTYYIEDLSPGYYYVSVRSFNDLGIGSDYTPWVQVILYGNTVPPANVAGFNAYQNGDVVVFTWQPIADVDLLGYELRYGPNGTSTWDTAALITKAERGSEVTSALVPPGNWTFFIKAQDTTGLYSATAATDNTVVVNQASTISNVNYQPDWPGTLTNFVRHWTGKLIPDDQHLASYYTNFEWCDTFVPTPFASCSFETPEIDTTFDDLLRAWASADYALGPGVAVGTPNATLEVDYRTTAGSYGPWETTSIGLREGRFWKFRLTLDTTVGKCVISEFQSALDKTPVVQSIQDIAVPSGGLAITFPNRYHTKPNVSVVPTGSTPLVAAVSAVTAMGFNVQLFDTAGAAQAGTIDYSARGA